MTRTTLALSDELHEELRLEAFHKRLSMATVIRMRLERKPVDAAAAPIAKADPILALAGLAPTSDAGPLTANLDDELYGGNN